MHFLYVSDARDWVRCVPPHVEELVLVVPAALFYRAFQTRHGFMPRRCLISLRPNLHVSSAPLPVFFLHLSYLGRPCVEMLSRRDRTSFSGLEGLTLQVS